MGVDSFDARRELFNLVLGGYSGFDLNKVEVRHLPKAQADTIRQAFHEAFHRRAAEPGTGEST